MADPVRVAVVSMTSGSDKAENLNQAERWIRESAAAGAKWIFLPEMFSFMGSYGDLHANAEPETGSSTEELLSSLAKSLNIWLFAGSFPKRVSGEKKVHNQSYVYGPDGFEVGSYRKQHLFNLYDEQGKALHCESDGYLSGDEFSKLDVKGYRVGLGICYDLRFSGFFNALTKEEPVDVLVLPSAFTEATGKDHWEVLLRARAIEYQCYVIAANQVGNHGGGKVSYGHSMVIDPWGVKIADCGQDTGFALGTIRHGHIHRARSRLPVIQDRRSDLYM